MSGHSLVVAGDDLDGHTVLRHRADRGGGRLLRRIQEDRKAGEYQFRLVGHHRRRMIHRDGPIGHAKRAAALFADAFEAGHQLRATSRRQRDGATIGLLGAGAQAQYVLRCALDDQQPLAALLDQYRDPSALRVKRHLVQLAPCTDVDAVMLQDGIVQRTL